MEVILEDLEEHVKKVIGKHGSDIRHLIPILQAIQEEYGYLPAAAISVAAEELRISEDVIFGVATFYTHFKFTRPGKHTIKACLGTACFVKEAENLLEILKDRLDIKPGETTADGNISLERVACLGCCALAPTIVVDEEVYGKMTPQKLTTVIDEMLQEAGNDPDEESAGNGSRESENKEHSR